jgi:UDP-2,4-diacetamido-2,4,6-trideoxy-beta-L-altropyranose hydrolase
LKGSAELLVDPPDLSESMAWADLAVSAAGSTCWELAFMGTPAAVIITAENQVRLAEELSKLGVVANMGWADHITARALAATVKGLLASGSQRTQMSLLGQGLVDGDGVDRVIMYLTGQSIRLRTVREEDRTILWTWANEPDVREASFSPQQIEWDRHVTWFSEKLHDPGCVFLMAVNRNDEPIGQVRFDVRDRKPDDATISVSVERKYRNKGHGINVISYASQRLFRETQVKTIHAYVKTWNEVSITAFSRAGFRHESVTNVRNQEAVHLMLQKEPDK